MITPNDLKRMIQDIVREEVAKTRPYVARIGAATEDGFTVKRQIDDVPGNPMPAIEPADLAVNDRVLMLPVPDGWDAVIGRLGLTGRRTLFDVRSYGAKGDGTNDHAAMQAAADAADTANGIFYVPPGMTFRTDGVLDLRGIAIVWIKGTITVGSSGRVDVGHVSGSGAPQEIWVHNVAHVDHGTQTNPCLRIVGLKDNRVFIEASHYLEYYADGNVANDSSSYYNDIEVGFIHKIVYNAINGGALNETRFWGGRITDLDVSGNHNRFYDNSFESSEINFLTTAENCAVLHGRFEGTCEVNFDTDTTDNIVQQSWASIASTIWPTMTVTDLGFNNRVFLEKQEGSQVTVWRADRASRLTDVANPWYAGLTDADALEPGFFQILMPASSNDFWDSGLIPLEVGEQGGQGGASTRIWTWASDQAYWRPRVFVYDSNRVLLTDGDTENYMRLTGGWVWQVADNCYSFNSNQSGPHRMVFDHPDAKYARIVMRSGNPSQPAWFDYVEVCAYVLPPYGDQITDLVKRRTTERPLASDTAPTKSLLPLGDGIRTTTGFRPVVFYHETTLTADEVSTNITMNVVAAAGAAGDLAAVELDNGRTHWTTVSGTPGPDIVLASGLPSSASIGKRVVVTRFGSVV